MRLALAIAVVVAAILLAVVRFNLLDPRPVHRLLFLGHSLTYYNDMPEMVAKMADSANSPVRYEITMNAFPNASVEDHWNNSKTRDLLQQGGWTRVILQPERSFGAADPGNNLYEYGTQLLAGKADQPPVIIISHLATDTFYRKHWNMTRDVQATVVQRDLRGLANAAGADVIDIASVWDSVMADGLPFSLYKDGNHPSLEGSYLCALVVYAGLSYDDVTKVTYVPAGMSSDRAALLRKQVQAALQDES